MDLYGHVRFDEKDDRRWRVRCVSKITIIFRAKQRYVGAIIRKFRFAFRHSPKFVSIFISMKYNIDRERRRSKRPHSFVIVCHPLRPHVHQPDPSIP